MERLNKIQLTVILIAGGLLLLSLVKINQAQQGLIIEEGKLDGLPFQITYSQEINKGKRPIVLVAHGLAGSGLIMRGFALTLAHAGYVAVTWDFDGHAGNALPMETDIYKPWLLENTEQALRAVKGLEIADTNRVAILGHSMGTAAALTFAQQYPFVKATVAVSPVGTTVTDSLPQNLLLLAGELEPRFVANAEARLEEAGGIGGDILEGTARQLRVLPGLEHISIIFAAETHHLALDWLDQTFGTQAEAKPYIDKRLLWFAMLISATLALAGLVGSLFPSSPKSDQMTILRSLSSMLLAVGGATILMWIMTILGLETTTALGLRTGGYLVWWFFLAGLLGLVLSGVVPARPERQELLSGMLIFIVLWLGVGLVGDLVWLPWLLIPKRLLLFPLVVLALFPWFYFVGSLGQQGGVKDRMLWWFSQSVHVLLALMIAVQITTGLKFLVLLLPLFPVILLFHAIPNISLKGIWSFALSGSLFVAWMTLAVFPLV